MAEQKVKEATSEFDMLPVPEKPRAVQVVSLNGFLAVLMSDGRLYERVDDNSKVGQPFGPHWKWREVNLPSA